MTSIITSIRVIPIITTTIIIVLLVVVTATVIHMVLQGQARH